MDLENADGRVSANSRVEGVSMSEKRRVAVRNAGAFLGPGMSSGGGNAPMPTNALSVGVGEPGPGDEWKMPEGPINLDAIPDEPAHQLEHESLVHRLTHKG